MKIKHLPLLVGSLLWGASLPAANIAWVSFHSGDSAPSGGAAGAGFSTAPDAGYTALLAAQGHKVNRFVTVDNIDQNPELVGYLETNDIVIIGRSVPSGHYQTEAETATWNSAITKPMIVMGGYITRGGTGGGTRLGFTTGETVPDVNSDPVRLRVNAPLHPIFNGVALDANNLMVNPYARRVVYTNATTGAVVTTRGISVNNNTVAPGGTVLAVIGTTGDAALNGMVIAEFPKDTLLNARDYLAGNRLVFFSGSREADGVSAETAGIFDLFPDGEKLFLNSVNYLLNAGSMAPQFVGALPSGVNLMVGDPWTFTASVIGTPPFTYEWYKNNQLIPSATEPSLVFSSLTLADAGQYYAVAANALGRATSSVATLQFATFSAPSLTNGIVSYWPLDTAVGGKTPDLVNSYDLNLINLDQTALVNGKWGKAFSFENPKQTILQRVNQPGEELPISVNPNFTVSLWVSGLPQPDRRVFSEGSTLENNTLFNLGTHNAGTDGTVDIFIRNAAGTANPNHAHSTATAFDGSWHNIVYIQRDIGGGQTRGTVYVDGQLDPVAITPVVLAAPKTTSIGGILRATASAWFTGLIDEVAVWNRILSPEEVQALQVTPITNAPSKLQPLTITSFRADLPAVVKGSPVTLRWDVNKDVTQVTIDQGVGDVTSSTFGGVGTNRVTVNETTTYTITARRDRDSAVATATTTIAALDGVAPGWTLLDNFDRYAAGPAKAPGYWVDAGGDSAQYVNYKGNIALKNTAGGSVMYLPLLEHSFGEGQIGTLFFRLITGTNTASGVTNIVALTDKTQRSYGDAYQNLGPGVYAAALTNDSWAIDTNSWYIGARNGFQGNNVSNPIDWNDTARNLPPVPLAPDTVYNVWIEFTNAPMDLFMSDVFSVYIQKLGEAGRTLLYENYSSDRDFFWEESVLGGMRPILDKVVVLGNSATLSALFDDFYLSKGAYNSTVPRAYEFTGSVGPLPALSIGKVDDQVRIQWTSGVLQESSNLTGWTDVPGATPPSYTVAPGAGVKFYRARQ